MAAYPQAMPPTNFPSPERPGAPPTGAFKASVDSLKIIMSNYDPGVVRQAVREMWEITLGGSEYHTGFICSTMFFRASPHTLVGSMRQHGGRLVKYAASDIANIFSTRDLDTCAHLLLPKFSPTLLDKALALRLESIQAQQLVNALGRAERLGYDVRDVVRSNQSDSGARKESIIPTANSVSIPPAQAALPPTPRDSKFMAYRTPAATNGVPDPTALVKLAIAFCERCNRPCGGFKALMAHRKNGNCGQTPPPLSSLGKEYCIFCGQFFATIQGLKYHTINHVCGRYSTEVEDALKRLFADAERVLSQRKTSEVQTGSREQVAPDSAKDPTAILTPDRRQQFEAEMARVEELFGAQMKKALELPEAEQKIEIARLKNSFNNKQSTTRKKFGVLLRERRTKQEIEEERIRMLGSDYRGTPTPSLGKRPRSSGGDAPLSGSSSRQGTPSKRVMHSDKGAGDARSASPWVDAARRTASPLTTGSNGNVTPTVGDAGAAATAATTAKPLPMSIAGSYTKPVTAPDKVANGADVEDAIEIDGETDKSQGTQSNGDTVMVSGE